MTHSKLSIYKVWKENIKILCRCKTEFHKKNSVNENMPIPYKNIQWSLTYVYPTYPDYSLMLP